MSIINNITTSNRRRDKLSNSRNGFTSGANVIVLTLALVLFSVMDDPIVEFRVMVFIAMSIGTCTSLFYVCIIREVPLTKDCEKYDKLYKEVLYKGKQPVKIESDKKEEGEKEEDHSRSPLDWLKEMTFYIHGLIYMLVRIAVNVTMTAQPFYLQLVLGYG